VVTVTVTTGTGTTPYRNTVLMVVQITRTHLRSAVRYGMDAGWFVAAPVSVRCFDHR
jgi:hypothetical protein